ncbi:MAG: hypothetical protein ACKVPX_16240 [Myxococcaceae bacterium]
MAKALVLSVLVALLGIPLWASKEASPRRALKRAIVMTLAFNVVYTLATLFIYPKIALR